jgi:3-oxoacyl-[acyl-carrier protein] reductase
MDLGLTGRSALVCGATSGLGEAVARALAAEGARVMLAGRRGDRAAAIAAELPDAAGVGLDLTESDGAQRLAVQAVAAFGQVDILVLNGGGPRPGRADSLREQDIRDALGLLLLPQQRLLSLLVPPMRERRWGRVLAIGSSGVAAPLANLASSNLGRAALAAYLKTLATEVARDGVTVNLLLPGRIETGRTAELDAARAAREGRAVADVAADSQASIPAGRYGQVAEFAAVAAFLCSARASYVTGSAMRCDGGLVPFL